MLNTYYTLHAQAREWHTDWVGARIGDAFSPAKGELSLALATPEQEWMLRVSVEAPLRFVFSHEGYNRPNRNVTTLFERAFDQAITAVRTAERDRMLFLDLAGGLRLQVFLFGPRPNVFLTAQDGRILEAFKSDHAWAGQPAPPPRPAPLVDTFETFRARWDGTRKTTDQALSRAFPLFDRILAAEILGRATGVPTSPAACTETDLHTLFSAARTLIDELNTPAPRLYWKGELADTFSLIPLRHLEHLHAEPFDRVSTAVRVFVRTSLAQRHFAEHYQPLHKALAAAHDRLTTRSERMMEELAQSSRADRYEHWGHLLMASLAAVPAGVDEATVPDLFGDGSPTLIPLDPGLSAVENAQRYYAKARQTRQARIHAEARLDETLQQAEQAGRLLDRLNDLTTVAELKAFRKQEAEALKPFTGAEAVGEERIPFRRFTVPDGYEVWVGRNARQNDLLTLRHARKYDYWLHARGVAGSHVVLRRPNRHIKPSKRAIEAAAAIAAHFSDARHSGLAPVQVTERKYVRKPKGAPPGTVVLAQEEVVLVEPGLPP